MPGKRKGVSPVLAEILSGRCRARARRPILVSVSSKEAGVIKFEVEESRVSGKCSIPSFPVEVAAVLVIWSALDAKEGSSGTGVPNRGGSMLEIAGSWMPSASSRSAATDTAAELPRTKGDADTEVVAAPASLLTRILLLVASEVGIEALLSMEPNVNVFAESG